MDEEKYKRTFVAIYGAGKSKNDRVNEHWKNNSPLHLVNQSGESLNSVRWYFDCGDDDYLLNGNMELVRRMKDYKIAHEFRIRDGAHNWTYWRTGIIDALAFISLSLHR